MKVFRLHLVVIFLFVNSCSWAMSENEKFIQGTWHTAGELTDGGYPFAWYMDLTFKNGEYTRQGYPPYYGEGKYKVIKSEGDLITIKYSEGSGNESGNTREVTFTVDRKNNTLAEGDTIMTRKN